MQAFRAVDLDVEERVEEIEARHPERDGGAEQPRLPRQVVRDRDPGADGGEAVDRAEPEVAEPREALEVRVDDEARDRNRPEPVRERRELEHRDEEERKRRNAEERDLDDAELAARQLAT